MLYMGDYTKTFIYKNTVERNAIKLCKKKRTYKNVCKEGKSFFILITNLNLGSTFIFEYLFISDLMEKNALTITIADSCKQGQMDL